MGDWDGRSREGRFRNALREHGALVSRGTTTGDLIGLAEHFRREGILLELVNGNKKERQVNVKGWAGQGIEITC